MVDSFVPSDDAFGDASVTVIGDDRPAAQPELALPRGSQVGRYVVLSRLGAGAMGVVVAAYDPELDRKVALKLLHPRDDRRAHLGQRRLLAEAQALARLSNPNVVAVHDAGLHEGRVFVAMEFVAGRTLKDWIAEAPRPWPEVLDVMARAGRGLAAAHAQGLVHRDFKPENVMLGDDGRVRVMDFGLARAEAEPATSELDADVSQPRERALDLALTQFGAVVGTPAYMAPEQLIGGRGGPAADLFSFCTSLWEALYGQRPFVDETLPGLQARILQGEITPPPPGRPVPRWLRRAVERGLAVDPALRWPSMQALLSVLERGRARARWRRGLVAAGVLVLAVGGGVGWQRWQVHRRVRACEAAGASIAETWSDDAAARVRQGLLDTGLARAEVTFEKVRPWIDAQAHAWQDARTEVCLDAEVRGTADADTTARALWCLDTRRMELESLVGILQATDARAVDRAVGLAAGLDRVDPCLDANVLALLPVPPPEGREAVRASTAELTRMGMVMFSGDPEPLLERVRAIEEAALALDWPPLVALARYRKGQILQLMGDYAGAEHAYERAYFGALRADALETAIPAASSLAYVVGYDLARRDEGLRWSEHEAVLIARRTDPTGLYELHHLNGRSAVHFAAGELDEVEALQRQLLALQQAIWLGDHPALANTLNNLANARYRKGRHAEAEALYRQAGGIVERTLGAEHPWIADNRDNLGLVAEAQGRHREARALHEQALAIREASMRPDHPTVAATLNNLAITYESAGEYDEAIALHERALAIWEATFGPEHPDVALSLNNLAFTRRLAGYPGEARPLHERALAIWEAARGSEHADVANALHGLVWVALDEGRAAEAVPLAERALALREAAGLGPDLLAASRFVLARALWDGGGDRARAVELARRAAADHRERGAAGAEAVADVERWLAEHPLPPQDVGGTQAAQSAQSGAPVGSPPEPR